LSGIAVSGRFSITISRLLLIAAWGVGVWCGTRVYGPCRSPGKFILWIFGTTALMLWLVIWARPEVVPQNYGILTPLARKPCSFDRRGVFSAFEIGDSGVIFLLCQEEANPFYEVIEASSLTIESINGEIFVSTKIRDRSDALIIELIRNEWRVAPPPKTWDRNYTKDTLEVLDSGGRVILQVKALPDRIQLQGEWWNEQGKGFRIAKNPDSSSNWLGVFKVLSQESGLDEPRIEPIFQYPSDSHFGELRCCPPRQKNSG
jgi:hypothetical protein